MTSKEKRPPIPVKTQLKLWLAAGGRCELPGCNKIVYRDGLTLKEGNWSNIAHIISWSPNGPRGDSILSKKFETDFTNLMLMCTDHARMIDIEPYVSEYTVSTLKYAKSEHEKRIETLTAIVNEAKTHVLIVQSNIGNNPVEINLGEVYQAITENKMYPSYTEPFLIDLTGDIGEGGGRFYEAKAREISSRLQRFVDKFNSSVSRQHISIFSLALMPLLVYLGKELGDKHSIQLFQHHRSPSNWVWHDLANAPEFIFNKPQVISQEKNVYLKIALSDYIGQDKLNSLPDINSNIYEITVENPTTGCLVHRDQIPKFDAIYRQALNEIQKSHGVDCHVHLLLAAPAPIAVQCGLSLLTRKDPHMIIYDYNSAIGGFFKALTI